MSTWDRTQVYLGSWAEATGNKRLVPKGVSLIWLASWYDYPWERQAASCFMLSPWQPSANLSVSGKTDHGVRGWESVYRGEWRLFKVSEITEERHTGRHVESGSSQLRLQTVLWDAGTNRTSWEGSQQVHTHPRNPSSACPLVYDRWRQEVMSRPSQRWTRGPCCLQRTDWATRPSSPPNPPHWEAISLNLQVLYAKPTSHAKIC